MSEDKAKPCESCSTASDGIYVDSVIRRFNLISDNPKILYSPKSDRIVIFHEIYSYAYSALEDENGFYRIAPTPLESINDFLSPEYSLEVIGEL